MQKITAHLIGENITSNSKEARDLQHSKSFGERFEDKVSYMLVEALYLLEKNQIEILDIKDRPLKLKKLLKQLLKFDKRVQLKYSAYRDLREKGLIPKTAFKYGADFRVYKNKANHSKWLCFVDSEKKEFRWQDFAGKNRIAHSTKKQLLLAIVDEEDDVSYFEINWIRF